MNGLPQTLRMFQVDAFADRVFCGNPAAVLLLDNWLPDTVMQALAQENNLAETAFACRRPDDAWDLRWFAPRREVAFCGHGTLATAHVILTEIETTRIGTAPALPVLFHTRAGRLQVTRCARGYRLDLPCLPPEPLDTLPESLQGTRAMSHAKLFRNSDTLFADLGSAAAVRAFVPDPAAIARLEPFVGLVVTGLAPPGDRADFVSRFFAPAGGIPEDPVTGSVHATLVPYWAKQLGRGRLTAFQASARGGWLDCELAEDRVSLTGNAVTFMEATIFLPAETSAP